MSKNILAGMGITFDYTDKVVLVTGANSGIGRASAIAFAQAGAKVILVSYEKEKIEQMANELTEAGYDVFGAACDIADEASVQAAVDAGVQHFGKLDIAFNNAGVQISHQPLADMTSADFNRIIDINLRGDYNCMKAEIPYMLKNGKGVILNTASQGGLVGIPTISGYTASKHGVVGLTTSAALEYARAGIRINTLCPGTCDTPMVAGAIAASPDELAKVIGAIPLGRMGKAEELAATVLFLCSDGAGFMVGAKVAVDGGYTAI